MKNILITGAGGFIGRHIIEQLCQEEAIRIFALSRKENCFKDERVECVVADIMQPDSYEQIFKENKIDCVMHLAAITEHDAIVNDKVNTLMTNLYGTQNILSIFNKYCNNAQFIYTSTGKVYGKTNEMPISENAICNPTNILGKSKYITERMVDFCAVPENKYLICRIFNVYGIGQKPNFVFPTIINQLENEEIALGSIFDKRDYLYFEDLINALICCIQSKDSFSDFDIVNIGSGEAYSVDEIIKIIGKDLNKDIKTRIDEKRMRTDETDIEYCINKKMIDITGWHPKYSMQEGIREILLAEGLLSQQ